MSRFTILTMMRDEGPALLEWVAFHRMIGAERIVVYTNDCRDGTDAMLDRLAEIGAGVIRRENLVPEGGKPQPLALTQAQKDPAVVDTDWLIAMDADEFLHVKVGDGHLRDLVAAVPADTEGIVMTWRTMGSSGHVDWNPGPVLASYTRGAPDGFRKGWGVKTLFKPYPRLKLGIHRPAVKGAGKTPEAAAAQLSAMRWVNGSGKPMTDQFKQGMWRSTAATLGYGLAEIAHYAVKSREGFLLRSVRGNVNAKANKYNDAYFAIFDRNEVALPALARRSAEVQARVADYLRDPVLADLHTRALDWHRARIEGLRADPGHAARLAALDRAATMPFERLDEVVYEQPLGPEGWAHVADLRAKGTPEAEIARILARAAADWAAERDAQDYAELERLGITPDFPRGSL